ncbi:MAG: winged helix-turn-helix domain-containing protein [Nanoarchaeota archaeon]
MNQEMLFTATKWDILSILSKEGKSPIQIAKIAKTSVANVSQQLRLLEMAGLVASVRVPNRDRGQPRLVYSLVKSTAMIILLEPHHAEKKQITLNAKRSAVIKILLLDDEAKSDQLFRMFMSFEDDLDRIKALYADFSNQTLYIVSDDDRVKKKHLAASVQKKSFKCQFVSAHDAQSRMKGDFFVLYDPSHLKKNEGEVVL